MRFASKFKTLAEVWRRCEHPQWLIWLAQQAGSDPLLGSLFVVRDVVPHIPVLKYQTGRITPVSMTWTVASMYCTMAVRDYGVPELNLCNCFRKRIPNPFVM